jgi:hypothetical protein
MDEYRIVVDYDPDPDLFWIYVPREEYERDPVIDFQTGRVLSYEEYTDPENYSVFVVFLERMCPDCGHWHILDTVGGVTYFRDRCPVYPGAFSLEKAKKIDPHLLELFGLEMMEPFLAVMGKEESAP